MMRRDVTTTPLSYHKSKSFPSSAVSASTPTAKAPQSTGVPRTTMRSPLNVNMTMSSPSATTTTMGGRKVTKSASTAVPGRPRRRGNRNSFGTMSLRSKKDPSQSIRYRLMNAKWMKNMKNKGSNSSSFTALLIAVGLWYFLGVISITTSNLLMMASPTTGNEHRIGSVPPLFLTLQQLILGTILLRLLLNIGFMGSRGIQPWPSPSAAAQAAAQKRRKNLLFHNHNKPSQGSAFFRDLISSHLVLAGICFAMGFLATNSGFLASSAAFVETIKAAEPITSAAVAVLWKIESLSSHEVLSLGSIVAGVLISTLAHGSAKGASSDSVSVSASFVQSLQSCAVVMTANLCFSFRGLFQKLFRASAEGSSQAIDDLNLQLRMQQIGVLLLAVPVIIIDLPGVFSNVWQLSSEVGLFGSGLFFRYVALSLINGIAFTSYNLASTFILSRISVVHHAALNCIRRIFAIIVTSIYFQVPITIMGIFGFIVSFCGFMSFTHFKIKRQKQPKPLSSLLPVSATAMTPEK